jgi:hypothetical protein
LESQSFTDGFRVCLLGVDSDRALDRLETHATLFDGGRVLTRLHHLGSLHRPAPSLAVDLRRAVAHVAAPPHVLAVFGRGWRALLAQCLPRYAAGELRLLDLLPTAAALRPDLRPHADAERIRRSYGLGPGPAADALDSPLYERILWAVIAEAGRLGYDWPDLLAATQRTRTPVRFDRYAFAEDDLAALPDVPGVYLMRDARGEALYVGKSARLARRVADYFRPGVEIPPKLRAIRERIHTIECRRVGSELEALLVENALIGRHQPALNVQRAVAKGASRYACPILPVAIVCPSVHAGAVEVFLCGDRLRALQCRVRPGRAPRRALRRAIEAVTGGSCRGQVRPPLTDWGVEGNAICCRYFTRFRERLAWAEVNLTRGVEAFLDVVLDAARDVLADPREAVEFRLADGDRAVNRPVRGLSNSGAVA